MEGEPTPRTHAITTLEPGKSYFEAFERHFGIILDAPYDALREPEGTTPF